MKSVRRSLLEQVLLALAWPFGQAFWFFASWAYHAETKRLRKEALDE